MKARLTGVLTIVMFLAMALAAQAEVTLPSIIGSEMVLQHGRPVPIWGKADPGETVEVTVAGSAPVAATADAEGRWRVNLPAQQVNDRGITLTIKGSASAGPIVLSDILVGEVWFCSGQSNMQWTVKSSNHSAEEIASAQDPLLRLFQATHVVADAPQFDNKGKWQPCTPQSVSGFSAVAYFFGRQLRRELGVPVGLIHSSWGGTPAEAWTSLASLAADPLTQPIVARWDRNLADYPAKLAAWEKQVEALRNAPGARPARHPDPGMTEDDQPRTQPGFDDSTWSEVNLPAQFEDTGEAFDGTAWYRRRIDLPPVMRGKPLVLELGAIDDFDHTFVNGVLVGRMDKSNPDSWSTKRRYDVPAELTGQAQLVLAVRVFDHFGGGGFTGVADDMRLSVKDGNDTISLAGAWKMAVTQKLLPATGDNPQGMPPKPQGPDSPHRPASLYHAMVLPFAPYGMAGAIWYQGESNASRGEQYRPLLAAMVEDWRKAFELDVLPFGIVQLANFQARATQPGDSPWAELREAQTQVAMQLPKGGLAVAIDIGDEKDIHPRNKQDVGARLAAWALHDIYGRSGVVPSGPLFREAVVEGDRIRLRFDHAQGLTFKGERLTGFAIAGEDRKFVWAEATIDGESVVVNSPDVSRPVAVRYGWANNPDCNLYNAAELPASPFRTDDWPGVTTGKR